MSVDAVALFRPKNPAKLRPFLDLDDEAEESDGLYAEALGDGAVLVHTFQPFEVFEQNPSEAGKWLAQFGDALFEVHEDPRGLLFFPDTCEPDGDSYDAVVEEVGNEGIWVAITLPNTDDIEQGPGWPDGSPPLDMQALQTFAGQLLGGSDGEHGPVTSFEVARLFEGVQQELLKALGMQEMQREQLVEEATTERQQVDAACEGKGNSEPDER